MIRAINFEGSDFFPLPCAHPNCHWLSLAVRSDEGFVPITKLVDARTHLDLLANGISFTRSHTSRLAQQLITRLACGETGCCTPQSATGLDLSPGLPVLEGNSAPPAAESLADVEEFLQGVLQQSKGARDMLRITITSFLDAYNFDVRRVMKCCTHHVLPSGHIIPFCAYNVLYREGAVPLPELEPQQPQK